MLAGIAHEGTDATSAADPAGVAVGSGADTGTGPDDLTSDSGHVQVHGAMPWLDRQHLLAELDAVDLTGRGGAAYPVAAKVRALRDGATPGGGRQRHRR
jgi:hypothetical protein